MAYSWRQALLSTISELPHHRGPYGEAARAYVIVDFRGHPDLLARITATEDLSFGSIWAQTGLDIYGDVAPLLIDVDGASQGVLRGPPRPDFSTPLVRVLDALHERDGGRYAMMSFASAVPLEKLIAHFGHFCDYALPDASEFFLHWYDTRILARALQVWTPAQRERFASPLITLRYPLRDGGQAELAGAGRLPQAPVQGIQRFTPEQHQMLFDLDYPDKIAVQLRRLYPGLLPGDPDQDALVPRVQAQLERARAHGVAGDKDTFDYVAWGVSISPRFDEHPRIREGLRAYRPDGDGALARALAGVPDAVWDEVQAMHHADEEGRMERPTTGADGA
ncbi:DUF4123 domain-containing protein [Achromobacter piechaudii]|uniref:DUF4123 domain-containing protein n=1 Tax=Achromobacter piechaudii TaxID=72556 RepID=A0A6S7E7F6_9BURK|nr:DUF4123 domain-containing protein [Achromobacter piechaudii]CAB3898535.1 hypothetical protein LMG1861_04167 [Achromobacter piechaudii]